MWQVLRIFFLFKPGRFLARHFSKETAQHLPFVNKEKCVKIRKFYSKAAENSKPFFAVRQLRACCFKNFEREISKIIYR
jgi:hypothetical protein